MCLSIDDANLVNIIVNSNSKSQITCFQPLLGTASRRLRDFITGNKNEPLVGNITA